MEKAKRKRGRNRTDSSKIVAKGPHGYKGIHPKNLEKERIDLRREESKEKGQKWWKKRDKTHKNKQ